MVLGEEESVLISEVSLFQGLKCTQAWYLGRKKVSYLERCPYFGGVLIEGLHVRRLVASESVLYTEVSFIGCTCIEEMTFLPRLVPRLVVGGACHCVSHMLCVGVVGVWSDCLTLAP